jgi:hypothetical protein
MMGRIVRSTDAARWGAGGTRVSHVHVEDGTKNAGLSVSITYEPSRESEAVFCVAFVDESGRDVGSAASTLLPLRSEGGSVRWAIDPFPLRAGVYFPVVAVLAPDGRIRDRWRLDRAIVIDPNGSSSVVSDFGPVEFAGSWTNGAV